MVSSHGEWSQVMVWGTFVSGPVRLMVSTLQDEEASLMRFFRNDGLWPVDAGIRCGICVSQFVPTQAWRVFGAIFVFPSDMEDEASVAAGCAHQGSALVSQRCDNDRFGNLMSFSNEESRSTSEVDAMNDIVRRAFVAGHGLVLSLGFGDCRTSFGAFNLTQSFERLLLACDVIRIDVRADLKRRHIELLKDVGKALHGVQDRFASQRSVSTINFYLEQGDEPSLYHNTEISTSEISISIECKSTCQLLLASGLVFTGLYPAPCTLLMRFLTVIMSWWRHSAASPSTDVRTALLLALLCCTCASAQTTVQPRGSHSLLCACIVRTR